MRYIPSWVPGAGFQKKATDWKKSIDHMRDAPFKFVKDAMVSALEYTHSKTPIFQQESTNAKSSFVSNAIHGIDPNSDIAERELIIRDAAGTAYAGRRSKSHFCAFLTLNFLLGASDTVCTSTLSWIYDRLPESVAFRVWQRCQPSF